MERPPGCSIIFARREEKPTPDKLTSITELANDTLSSVTDGYEPWAAFINTMSRNYKYSFADQLLIYAQRPDASACAGYDVWTQRMGRYVRRGAKGIALVDLARQAMHPQRTLLRPATALPLCEYCGLAATFRQCIRICKFNYY